MRTFETYYRLETKLAYIGGLNHSLNEITEICRTELSDSPRTTEKAQDLILEWWNNKKDKPSITKHRLSYFCLYHLRKEYNKLRLGK